MQINALNVNAKIIIKSNYYTAIIISGLITLYTNIIKNVILKAYCV